MHDVELSTIEAKSVGGHVTYVQASRRQEASDLYSSKVSLDALKYRHAAATWTSLDELEFD